MVTYEITKPDEWIGHYFPFKEVAEAGLQPTDFLILDFFARKQEYHKHEIADSLYEVSIKITLDLISETLCIPKSTVKDSLKRSEVKEMILRAKSGISALPKFVEMFYIIEDGKLKKKITGKVKKSADSAQKAPAKENSCAESAQDSGGFRTEHLIVYNKGINVSVAEDKSVFENENFEVKNEAPQVNANSLEEDEFRHIKENNICSDGLNQDDYYHALKKYLVKYLPKYTKNEDEMKKGIKAAFKHGLKFSATPGSKKGVDSFFARNRVFFETEQESAPDHTEVNKIVNDFLAMCLDNWHNDWRSYRAHVEIYKDRRDVIATDREALKKLYLGNKWDQVTFVFEIYGHYKGEMYRKMEFEWSKFAANRKATLEIAIQYHREHPKTCGHIKLPIQ